MDESDGFRQIPPGEFITEFLYPGDFVDGYDCLEEVWAALTSRPHSVFACFRCIGSVYDYLAQFGIGGVMRELPHAPMSYWTPHGLEGGWCFQIPIGDALFLTGNVSHGQGCTLYVLHSELGLDEFAAVQSSTLAEPLQCLRSLLDEGCAILFAAADEDYFAVTRPSQRIPSADGSTIFRPLRFGELVTDRVYPGTVIDWESCLDAIWKAIGKHRHSVFACAQCSGPDDKVVAQFGIDEMGQSFPNRQLEYCVFSGLGTGCTCFQLPSLDFTDSASDLLATGRCAVYLLCPDMTLDKFVQIHAETRTLPLSCTRRLLTIEDFILFASPDQSHLEITRRLTPNHENRVPPN